MISLDSPSGGKTFMIPQEDDHFIEMPDAIGRPAALANVGGDGRTELVGPATHGLVSDIDPAFGEHFLNIAQAHGEAEIEPHR